MNKSTPKITVVIGNYNHRDRLEKTMNSFKTQSIPASDYELIVVDSSSTDTTPTLLKEFDCDFHYQYLIQENKGKAAARNKGVEMAQASLILITDADMIAHPDLLKTHLDAHANTKVETCFEGVTMNMESYDWPSKPETLSPYITRNLKDGDSLGWWYFLTGNLSFPKTIFNAENGFDENFTGYGWEDLELGYRCFKKDIPLKYLKSAINYHYHVLDPIDEVFRCEKKGQSAQYFVQKHKELKYFLGLNPLSVFLYKIIKEDSALIRLLKDKWLAANKNSKKYKFSAWFLSEFYYLKGILNR